jgi:hypothetical protein
MPAGRPRKPAAYHKLVGNYRPSRHAEPRATSPEPELDPAEAALREECERWRGVFECGRDYFNDLDGLEPRIGRLGAEQDAAEACFLAAIREAWGRLGVMFLDGWKPKSNVTTPWALRVFGDPRQGKLKTPRRSLSELRNAFYGRTR